MFDEATKDKLLDKSKTEFDRILVLLMCEAEGVELSAPEEKEIKNTSPYVRNALNLRSILKSTEGYMYNPSGNEDLNVEYDEDDAEKLRLAEAIICCICGREIWYENLHHNPAPIISSIFSLVNNFGEEEKDRCCHYCNELIVVPERMNRMSKGIGIYGYLDK